MWTTKAGNNMLSILLKIYSFFSGLWNGLSEDQKNRIIDILINSFDGFLRKYYRESEKGNANG